jgi:hypothetical protein
MHLNISYRSRHAERGCAVANAWYPEFGPLQSEVTCAKCVSTLHERDELNFFLGWTLPSRSARPNLIYKFYSRIK